MSDSSRLSELIFRGDNRSAIRALEGISKQSEDTTSTLKGDADEQSASFDKVGEASTRTREAMSSLMGMVGIAGVGFGLKDLVEGGMNLQSAQAGLQAALRATGQTAAATRGRLEQMAESMSTRGGFATTQNLAALTAFTRETQSATAAQSMLALSTNIARGRNMGLASAQQIVARAYTGTVGKLQALLGPMVAAREATVGMTTAHQQQISTLEDEASMMGKMGAIWMRQQEVNDHITAQQAALATLTDKHATAQMVLAAATRLFAGSTSAYSRTATGQLSNLRDAFSNLTESLGQALLPAMDKIIGVGATVAEILAHNKTAVLAVSLAVAGLTAAWGTLKIAKELKKMFLELGEALGFVSAGETEAAAAGTEAAGGLTVAWNTFFASTLIGLGVIAIVEIAEHFKWFEGEVTGVWTTVSGAVASAWKWIEHAVSDSVDWIWNKIKWLADKAKDLMADTPLGGIIGFGSNLLGGHVGRAFGDLTQGMTSGIINPNAGTIGLPGNNVTGIGTIHIAPSQTRMTVDGRELGRAVTRWAVTTAARGPASFSGGSIVTGSAGLPVGG